MYHTSLSHGCSRFCFRPFLVIMLHGLQVTLWDRHAVELEYASDFEDYSARTCQIKMRTV